MAKCHGSYGCYGADIDAVNIIANGAYALNFATIESNTQTQLNVHSKGYLSGTNANVICRAGKICNIYCSGNGCKDLNFGCLAGSQCNVSPSICTPSVHIGESKHQNASVVNEQITNTINCPNWYLSSSEKADEELLTRFDEQRLDIIKKMEFDSPRNSDDVMELYHARNFRPQDGGYIVGKTNGLDNDNLVAIHSQVIEIVLFCSIYMIGFGIYFCYKRHYYSQGDYKSLDHQ